MPKSDHYGLGKSRVRPEEERRIDQCLPDFVTRVYVLNSDLMYGVTTSQFMSAAGPIGGTPMQRHHSHGHRPVANYKKLLHRTDEVAMSRFERVAAP